MNSEPAVGMMDVDVDANDVGDPPSPTLSDAAALIDTLFDLAGAAKAATPVPAAAKAAAATGAATTTTHPRDPIRRFPVSAALTPVTSLERRTPASYALSGTSLTRATQAVARDTSPTSHRTATAEMALVPFIAPEVDDDEDDSDIEYVGEAPPEEGAGGQIVPVTGQNVSRRGRGGDGPPRSSALAKRRTREWEDDGAASGRLRRRRRRDDAQDGSDSDSSTERGRSASPTTPLRELSPAWDGVAPCPMCHHVPAHSRRARGRGSRVLSRSVLGNLTALICGAPRGRHTNPEAHIRRNHPHLTGWTRITREVGAAPEDIERVRHAAGALMRELPQRVERGEL